MTKKNKKQALGRGLSALLDDPEREIISANDINADKVVGNIIDLDIDIIEVNPYQPRTYFNEDSIEELAKSISVLGIIQPVTVRKLARNQYQLVSGERRYRAAKSIGISALPAFVRIANDNEILIGGSTSINLYVLSNALKLSPVRYSFTSLAVNLSSSITSNFLSVKK